MGLALSPDAKQLFVSTGRGKKVFVVDTATNQVTANFEVGQRLWGIAVSPDGKLSSPRTTRPMTFLSWMSILRR